ncbi:MAG: hypothetical protein JWN15_2751, partial [Firmicutes bacterium]|nr:hypothetical protein [Bacillota bacterium]
AAAGMREVLLTLAQPEAARSIAAAIMKIARA